jgi:hypothetical protein
MGKSRTIKQKAEISGDNEERIEGAEERQASAVERGGFLILISHSSHR